MSTEQIPSMTQHPDLLELRNRFEQAAETPTAQLVDGLTVLAGLYVALSPVAVWVMRAAGTSTGTVASNVISGALVVLLGLGAIRHGAQR
ncbi:MAG: SPW repeat protein [Pseudonocardiaceae bacterium]